MGVGRFASISLLSLLAGLTVILGPYQGWFAYGPYPNLVVLGGTLLLTIFACSLVAAFVSHKREKSGKEISKMPPVPKVKSLKMAKSSKKRKSKKKSSSSKKSKKKPAKKSPSKKKPKRKKR